MQRTKFLQTKSGQIKLILHVNFLYIFLPFPFQSSSTAHLWELIHDAYGSDLGLTSDDDGDYCLPGGRNSDITLPGPPEKPKKHRIKAGLEVSFHQSARNLAELTFHVAFSIF
jgi:hypothetical protein